MQPGIPRYVIWLAACVAAISLFYGYDAGVFSVAYDRLRSNTDPSLWSDDAPAIVAEPVPPATALEFLGTGFTRGNGSGSASNTYFSFAGVAADCLPIYPVTIIWRARPAQKTGYYTTFFWGNDGPFQWNAGKPDSYWGAHPYPDTATGNFDVHHWEIATDFGGDVIDTVAGTSRTIETGRWLTQGFRAWETITGKKVHRFYIDLPSLNADSIIEARVPASFGNHIPPNASLVWGGAPWGRIYGNDETYLGLIRGIQVYNAVLTEQEMLDETLSPLSTSAGRESVWYMKLNPTIEDMQSDVESGAHGDCGNKKRAPVLRVDQDDVDLQKSRDRARIKVRSWIAP